MLSLFQFHLLALPGCGFFGRDGGPPELGCVGVVGVVGVLRPAETGVDGLGSRVTPGDARTPDDVCAGEAREAAAGVLRGEARAAVVVCNGEARAAAWEALAAVGVVNVLVCCICVW